MWLWRYVTAALAFGGTLGPPPTPIFTPSARETSSHPFLRAFGPLSSLSRLVLARRIRDGIQDGLPWARFPEDSTVDFEKIMRRTDASLLLPHACFGWF